MNLNQLEKPLGIALALSVLGLSVFILKPFFIALVWGGLIAFATWPAHTWLTRQLRSQIGSACLLSLIMALLIIAPMVAIGVGLAGDGKELIQSIASLTKTPLPSLPDWAGDVPMVGGSIVNYWVTWQAKGVDWFADAIPFLQSSAKFMLAHSGVLGSVLAQIALAIMFALWFYIKGQKIAGALKEILNKIMGAAHAHYWKVAADTVQNVINGILGTALAQGFVAGIGFWIAGVPAPFLLGAITFLVSLIPMAPPLIWIPAAGWLFLHGETGYGIFMALWGIFIISGVDNIVRPLLIGRGSIMPMDIILVGVIGGMLAFGFLGLFVGPVVLALSYTLVKEWLAQQNNPTP